MSSKTKQKMPKTNLWFFVGKSIGVTLLGLYALEQTRDELKSRVSTRRFLVVTDHSNIYKEILAMYPHIELVYLRLDNLNSIFFLVTHTLFQKNICFYPPSFGRASLFVRVFFRFLTLFHTSSVSVVALPQTKIIDRLLYSNVLKIDLKKNIFTAVTEMMPSIKPTKLTPPSLLFSYDVLLAKELPEAYIVFHPFAASEQRTYPDSLSCVLLRYLLKKYPEYTIIISAGPADAERAKKLIAQVEDPKSAHLIQTHARDSFTQTIQTLSGANLYIGVDTGITHLVAHLNVPSVVLGNRSNPMWLPTYSPNVHVLFDKQYCTCTPDKKGDCRREVDGREYYRCMVDISFQSLCSAIELRLHTTSYLE